jgi:arylsulfatase A-like enzyme
LAKLLGHRDQPASNWDGVDIRGPLLGSKQSVPERDLYWLWSASSSRWALRRGQWKIVRYGKGEPEDERAWQLFDLSSDPLERHDLAKQRPEVLRAMHARFVLQRKLDQRSKRR